MRFFATLCALSVVTIFTATIVAAQETAQPETSTDYDASTVIARVDDQEITLGHVIVMLSKLAPNYQNLSDDVLFPGIIEQLVNQILLGDSALKSHDGVPLEVRLAVENERRALLAANMINDIAAMPVAEEDLVAAYDELYGNLPAEKEYNAAHILVETEDEARALVAQYEEGADFGQLARDNSTGPSGPSGGALGWFGLGQMVPEFENAVVVLEIEQVSAPVQTQFGWHVIRLSDIRIKTPPSLEETREDILPDLQQKAVDKHLEALRTQASVEKFESAVPPSAMRDRSLLFTE